MAQEDAQVGQALTSPVTQLGDKIQPVAQGHGLQGQSHFSGSLKGLCWAQQALIRAHKKTMTNRPKIINHSFQGLTQGIQPHLPQNDLQSSTMLFHNAIVHNN